MTHYNLDIRPASTGHILDEFEHTRIGQQVAYDIATNFSSVSDMMSHTRNTAHGSVTELLMGDSVSFNVHKPRLRMLARNVAEYFGWNAS